MRVLDARHRYFADNGFSEESYQDRWVTLRVGPIPIVTPNPVFRRRAIPLHDLHHIATGYDTSWRGEAEISAWELGAGCGSYTAARLYGMGAMAIGLVVAPKRSYRAFIRGSHATSLYRTGGWSNELLEMDVGELRDRLRLDENRPTTWRDRLAFAGWAVASVIPPIGVAVVLAKPWGKGPQRKSS